MDEMIATGENPEHIIQRLWLTAWDTTDTSVLDTAIDGIVASSSAIVQQYRDGKVSAIGFFVGQVMKQTAGQYDPSVIKEKLEKVLQ
jgi:aspartyl-tRNA(Asn)/glutamyl-tRNA(Gln) amidotransferase subunit B